MGIYDIAMLVIFLGAIFFGYWKGLAWQIASLAALVVSYIVAVNFRDQLAAFLQVEEPWNKIGAMLILFLGTSLVIWAIYSSVSKSLKRNELKGFDRQAGAILGALKGGLLCMVVTMFAVSFLGEDVHETIDHSKFGPYIEKGIWQVSDFVPDELARFVNPHIENYKDAVGHKEPSVDTGGFFGSSLGTTYPVGQPISDEIKKFQSNGFAGRWKTPSGGNPDKPQNMTPDISSGGGFFGTFQKKVNPPQAPATQGIDWSNVDISEASKQTLENIGKQALEATNEAAENLFENVYKR
ncbi:MAG: CvpA family protein [Planctomycetaceae bacterium]|nr:CvpA family protein [Planctomycetaceae bacterium]MCP4476870.1 CvpA family protein [Planctomycetaceae bacterium]MCP4774954.1 CvpA family protein [Planctomycetaceae bacterium]